MGRPGFKPGGRRHALPGGFDSLSLPPPNRARPGGHPRGAVPGHGGPGGRGRVLIGGLSFPADLHYLLEHDVWVRPEGPGLVTAGISALGIRLSGEIYMCRPKPVGSLVEQGRALAVVELAKAIVSVKSPVSGEVVVVNPALAQTPELVHRDPYGEGWLARLSVPDLPGALASLVHGEAARQALQARLSRIDQESS